MDRQDLNHLSFEFFPPKNERETRNLLRTARRLDRFRPDFYSVTHGAGGSTREGTFETIKLLRKKGFNAIPHLSWGTDSRQEMLELLHEYGRLGISQLVLLRGDRSADREDAEPAIRYAKELVELVRATTGNRFKINVACYPEVHPEASSLAEDLLHLQEKVRAGANCCITQYFYAVGAYQSFVNSCRAYDIRVPIIAGIMPISNVTKLVDFSAKCGAEIPKWLDQQLQDARDEPQRLQELGTDVVARLCRQLLDFNRCGLHFYTLNRAQPTQAIFKRLLSD